MNMFSTLAQFISEELLRDGEPIEGDENLRYGHVIELMNVLQQAGAEDVGLITEPPDDQS